MRQDSSARILTNLVELEGVELGAGLGEQLLGGLAVRAVRLGEDGWRVLVFAPQQQLPLRRKVKHTNAVLVDDVLSLGLCGRHAGGTGRAGEEASYEVNDGRVVRGVDVERTGFAIDGIGSRGVLACFIEKQELTKPRSSLSGKQHVISSILEDVQTSLQ